MRPLFALDSYNHGLLRTSTLSLFRLFVYPSLFGGGGVREKEDVVNSGPDWLFDMLDEVAPEIRPKTLMIIWRNWEQRSDLQHDKHIPCIEVTCNYLRSSCNRVCNPYCLPSGKATDGYFRRFWRGCRRLYYFVQLLPFVNFCSE